MSTPLPVTTAEAPGSLMTLDVEEKRKASVKSAEPDLLSFRPKSGSPVKETCSKSAPSGEGMSKSAARKASVATSLRAVVEANEEQGEVPAIGWATTSFGTCSFVIETIIALLPSQARVDALETLPSW